MSKRERPIKLRVRAYTGMPFPVTSYMMDYPRFSRHKLDAMYMSHVHTRLRSQFREQLRRMLGLSVALARMNRNYRKSNSPLARQAMFGRLVQPGRLPSFRQFLMRSIYVKKET